LASLEPSECESRATRRGDDVWLGERRDRSVFAGRGVAFPLRATERDFPGCRMPVHAVRIPSGEVPADEW
jgi:hypothetical protein